jgi:deoxyadenosine/deoxycytidine kinase
MKIVIDGNIGSGKTTQLDILTNENFQVVKEPIEKWPLDLFYSDPERWGFLFQLIILQTLQCLPTDDMVIYERCPLSSKEIFW